MQPPPPGMLATLVQCLAAVRRCSRLSNHLSIYYNLFIYNREHGESHKARCRNEGVRALHGTDDGPKSPIPAGFFDTTRAQTNLARVSIASPNHAIPTSSEVESFSRLSQVMSLASYWNWFC